MIDQSAVEAAAPAAPEGVEPVGYVTRAAIEDFDLHGTEIREVFLYPKGSLRPVNEFPLYPASALSAQAAEIERLRKENADFRTWGIIEVAVRNPNVSDYMSHWEARAERAEAALAAAKRRIEEMEEGLREYAQLSNWSYGGRFDANDGDFDGISFAESVLRDKESADAR